MTLQSTACPLPAENGGKGFTLFLVGFLVLFLELACIRWFAANVIFLQFFTNVVLIACFLGMSCGCMAARQRDDWLARFPFLVLWTLLAALSMLAVYSRWRGLAVDVGHQLSSAQEVFFGTEYRNPDVAGFVVPIELVAGLFFVLVALLFVGLGQVLGRALGAYPNRVLGYTLNIGGSLTGIAGFSALSLAQAPPLVWFLISFAGVAYLLWQGRRLTWLRGFLLVASLVAVALPISNLLGVGTETRWSPYYAVVYDNIGRDVIVNTIGHQAIVPFENSGSPYSLIYLLQRGSGGRPLRDILIIGAGTGNDVAHALRFGARRIDAVEIDPVIQDLGIRHHPDHPYQDPRVFRHLDDGRHFLRTTDRKYDVIVYGLVDSLILHSSYSNLRLESYLFTEEAFSDVRRALRPDGIFVMYNNFRQGWIVDRIATMADDVFGRPPIILNLPHQKTLGPDDRTGFTLVVAGDNRAIAAAFRQHGTYWMNRVPTQNLGVDGFAVQPVGDAPPAQRGQWVKIATTTLTGEPTAPLVPTDDWPFLYLRGKLLPDLTVRFVLLLGLLGVLMVYFFLPRGGVQVHSRMFFLGAAFMLLETKAVVQLALLFGSTWVVNSLVFFTILALILCGNLYVLKVPGERLTWPYAGLLLLLAANILIPLEIFIRGGILWRYVTPCALVLGPIFFAGIIFARTFREAANPDQAFGSNIAGSVMGGLAESLSLVLGFRELLLVAMAFYVLSAGIPSVRKLSRAGTPADLWAPK
jgi:SAM-dependent methyltransferase